MVVAGIAIASMVALGGGVASAAPTGPGGAGDAAADSMPCYMSLSGGAVSHAGPGAGNAFYDVASDGFYATPPDGCDGGGGGTWSNCLVIDSSQTLPEDDSGVIVICPDDATAGSGTGLP